MSIAHHWIDATCLKCKYDMRIYSMWAMNVRRSSLPFNCCSSLCIPILIRPHIHLPTAACVSERALLCAHSIDESFVYTECLYGHGHTVTMISIRKKLACAHVSSTRTHSNPTALTIIDIIVVWKVNQTRLPQYDAVRVGAEQQQ